MAKAEKAGDKAPSAATAAVIRTLHAGRVPVDPTLAAWHDDASTAPYFGYYNFHFGRFEYGKGRIPKERLWMYSDPRYNDIDSMRKEHGTGG